jgi:RNA ligase (TIGR02306 family)
MSEWKVQVVKVGALTKHPNADRLLMTKVFDYPILTAIGEHQEGDLAVYVPVDSVVPADDSRWEFLKGHNRVKAKRLRGIFSMGLLTKAVPGMAEGEIVAEQLRITKYEPPEPMQMGGDNEKCPFEFPVYTDIEAVRRWPDVLKDGEEVQLTEKVHGANARYVYHLDRLWAGSHTGVKKPDPNNLWWKAANEAGLEAILRKAPGIAFYGEVYGQVQDLKYGHTRGGSASLLFFDAMDLVTRKYLDLDEFEKLATDLGLKLVPKLYRGPWKADLSGMAEGKTLVSNDHVREGFVVRPVKERFDERIQRVILKRHGEGYLTR